MSKIVIIHFQPLESYPPIQNLIRFLENEKDDLEFIILTNFKKGEENKFTSNSKKIRIIRFAKTGNDMFSFFRYLNYLLFYSGSLFKLIWFRPNKILYYETLSSLPAFLYKRYFNTKVEILIHYHEYTSPEEYKKGMKLGRYFFKLERWLLPRSSWLSHTNDFRMERFIKDISPISIPATYILPNYPPRVWLSKSPKTMTFPIRIVYAGALSLKTMYTLEFIDWVQSQNGKVIWDIYSTNIDREAVEYFRNFNSSWINVKKQVPYESLPSILSGYNVGVVLYKGMTFNYTFNMPNKLFEYLACGLDVWFPDKILGSLSLVSRNSYPRVLTFDFLKLKEINLEATIDRSECQPHSNHFFSENAFRELYRKISID